MAGNSDLDLFQYGTLSREGQVFQVNTLPSAGTVEKVLEAAKASLDARALGVDDWYETIKPFANSTWTITASALSFEFESAPTFLKTNAIERRIAYLILIFFSNIVYPDRKYLFVQRRHVGDPSSILRLQSVDVDEIAHTVLYEPFSKHATRFEYLAVKPLSVERSALRKKTLSSRDVRSNISSLGLNRSIPSAVKLFIPAATGGQDRRISINSTTKRVREHSAKSEFSKLVDWAVDLVAEVDGARKVKKISSAFLGAFAQPVTKLDNLTAESLLIDTFGVREALKDNNDNQILDMKGNELDQISFDLLMEKLGEVVPLSVAGGGHSGEIKIDGKIHVVDLRVLVKTCKLSISSLLYYVKTEGVKERLDQFIERRKFYRVLLDKGSVLFSPEGAFKDGDIAESAKMVLEMVHTMPALSGVTTEKGNPSTNANFDVASSFYAIRQHIAASAKWLVCDDSTDEWCDFLSFEETTSGPKITWLHAKVKRKKDDAGSLKTMGSGSRGSYSASALQEVVGQAVKNLGRLRLKRNSDGIVGATGRSSVWLNNYQWPDDENTPKTIAGFKRLCKIPGGGAPTPADINKMLKDFDDAANNPNTIYEVAIVVPNYRRTTFQTVFKKLGTARSSETAPQLFWLLSGYMSSCVEVGARPVIYCL